MSSELQTQVRDFILENYLFTNDASALGPDESLLDRGIVDSTGMLENLDSVNRIAAFVGRKK